MTTASASTTVATARTATADRPRTVAVTAAATWRSLTALGRSPALLISPLAQALFFMLIYAGQLSTVGEQYLDGRAFIAFLLPLILLTTVATGAGAAGTLLIKDLSNGYLDRLRLAHGSSAPFVAGTLLATMTAVAVQALATTAGAFALGYRPTTWSHLLGSLALLAPVALAVALLSVATAVRTRSASATGMVPLVVFGMSFFTGFFVPREQLSGWLAAVAGVNPLTPVVELMRQVDAGAVLDAAGWGLGVTATLLVVAVAACCAAMEHARRIR